MKKRKFGISFNSPIILWFTIICFAALLIDKVTGGAANNLLFSVYRSSLADPFTYIRFLGHVFGHAGWSHLFNNLMILLLVGPLLEEKYGSTNIALVMLVTALVTGIVNFAFFPYTQLLGASGIVFALILLSSFTCKTDGTIPVTVILVAAIYIGSEIYSGVAVHDNVSNFTHIIGGIIGAGSGYFLNKGSR